MRVAALDLGSNTFLCLIVEGEVDADGRARIDEILSDEVRMVRLGQDVDRTRRFHPDALVRAEAALADFQKSILKFRPDRILAMATSAARDVENAEQLFDLGRKFGIPIQIIPGSQEARITYAGATSGMNPNQADGTSTLVIDIGGGSTEFIRGVGGQMAWGHSLDLGCVRLKERLRYREALTSEIELEARSHIQEELRSLPAKVGLSDDGADFAVDRILAVAGTPTELARMEIGQFDPVRIDGFCFSRARIEEWIRILAPLHPQDIQKRYQVPAGRADVLVLGLLILSESLAYFGRADLQVSTRGVRFGVALRALTEDNE